MSVSLRVGQSLSIAIAIDDEDPASCQVYASSSNGTALRVESASTTEIVVVGLSVGTATLGITAVDRRGAAGSASLDVEVLAPEVDDDGDGNEDEDTAPPIVDPIRISTPNFKAFAKPKTQECIPLRLGRTNDVPQMTLTASPAPATPLDYLKNEYEAEVARFIEVRPDNDIVIEGALDRDAGIEYFALPNADLPAAAEVRLELFDAAGVPVPGLGIDSARPGSLIPAGKFRAGIDRFGGEQDGIPSGGWRALSSLIPAGTFRAGIDKFGGIDPDSRPDAFVVWLRRLYIYRSFRLTIRTNLGPGDAVDIRLRMILMGLKLELDKGFDYGSQIRYVTPPQNTRTGGGSTVPVALQQRSRSLSLPISHLTGRDQEALSLMEVELLGRPFIVSGFPAATGRRYRDHNFLARFDSALDFIHRHGTRYSVSNFDLSEV